MSTITAKEYFKDNKLFEFIKYEDNKTSHLSAFGSKNRYILKCKNCKEDNIKTGNSKLLLKCTKCGATLEAGSNTSDNFKEWNLDDAELVIAGKTKKTKVTKESDSEEEKKPEIKIESESESESEDESEEKKAPGDYKFYDAQYIVTVKSDMTDTLTDGRYITTDESKRNLTNHIYIPENKALAIDKYVFVRRPFSIFNNFKTVTNITEKEVKSKVQTLQPIEIAKINEKNKIAPADYFDYISKYFTPELEGIDDNSLIFNSKIEFEWKLKDDDDITFKCNPAKAYILALSLEKDDTFNIKTKSSWTIKKLMQNKDLGLSKSLIEAINEKFVINEEVDLIEWSYFIKKYVWNFKSSETERFKKLINGKEVNKTDFVFTKLEIEAFKMIVKIE